MEEATSLFHVTAAGCISITFSFHRRSLLFNDDSANFLSRVNAGPTLLSLLLTLS